MVVTDYVFEDEPVNSAQYFGKNLYVNGGKGGVAVADSISDIAGVVAGAIDTAASAVSAVANNAIFDAARKAVFSYAFGSPFSATTDALAAGMTIYERMANMNTDLGDLEAFRDGLGSIVEFRGKPIEVYPVNGGVDTLGELGTANLVNTVDNSLSMLLNLSSSPIIQSISALSSLIETAANAFGASTTAISDAKSKYSAYMRRTKNNDAPIISGSFMGFDYVMPFNNNDFIVVNPPKKINVDPAAFQTTRSDVQAEIDADVFGTKRDYEFKTLQLPTGSSIDFDAIKNDPTQRDAYNSLPREWRIRIEKEPERMSKKLLARSRRNSSDDLVAVIGRRKRTVPVESNVTKKLDSI